MFTLNSFTLRKDEAGNYFLDIDLNLVTAPLWTIIRLSIPAAEHFQPDA